MADETAIDQAQNDQSASISDKELNFRRLEQKYHQDLAVERARREEMERKLEELSSRQSRDEEEDDDEEEAYVDHKNLQKKLSKFAEKNHQQTKSEIQRAVQEAIREEKKSNWINSNPDFYDVLQHAEAFASQHPELADTILQMPQGFERQKLVYKNIKALGIDKPKSKEPSIQEKIDQNRRSPFYQPSGMANSPYQSEGNFSAEGKAQAYKKMLELKSRLRI